VSDVGAIDAVVTHHRDPTRSGVARFNQLLAEHLRVPLLALAADDIASLRCPLLSFKFSELGSDDIVVLEQALEGLTAQSFRLFLHEHSALPLENELIQRADRVYSGNDAVAAAVAALTDRVETVWAPGLITDTRLFEPAAITVFSFGMAHKMRTDMFERLHDLLSNAGQSYRLYVSNANHETATLEDARLVYEDMHAVFPRNLYFLGNLSDVAVYNYLIETTFFAAFFRDGARANNTSIASAMEHGAVVITNLDRHSPPHLRHMETVIDIAQCDELPTDPLALRRISVGGMEAARELSWDRLVGRLAT